jgi:putative NIF3 family GTP cyclohydrolase 1 type 2
MDLFLEDLKQKMQVHVIRYTQPVKTTIHKVAVCGGSGSFLLNQAIAMECDVFITADFKYHEFFDANDKIMIADIGHYESEQFTINLIKDLIIKKLVILRFVRLKLLQIQLTIYKNYGKKGIIS